MWQLYLQLLKGKKYADLCEPLWSIHLKRQINDKARNEAHTAWIGVRLSGPALAGAGPNARPRRGATLSSAFMTSSCSRQPCYVRGRAQVYSKALTRELSTFANVREEIR